jgi:putative tricarboxylic transport membrane protein
MFDCMAAFLESGFSLLPVLIGLFALSAIFAEAEAGVRDIADDLDMGRQRPFSLALFRGQLGNVLRSASIGTLVGMLPGIGGSAASVLAYTQQKNFSKSPERMGTGSEEGVIASESANNGLTGGALIPLLSLGIPGDSTTAVLIAAFTLQGIQVGPLFIANNMPTWHAMIAALVFANLVMFAAMFGAIRQIAKVVLIPKHVLNPIIVMMCVVGAYAINHGIMFDVWTLLVFGLFGYLAQKAGIEIVPLVIGFILGPSAEVYFVKSIESHGSLLIFFTKSPIAAIIWVLLGASIWFSRRNHRTTGS